MKKLNLLVVLFLSLFSFSYAQQLGAINASKSLGTGGEVNYSIPSSAASSLNGRVVVWGLYHSGTSAEFSNGNKVLVGGPTVTLREPDLCEERYIVVNAFVMPMENVMPFLSHFSPVNGTPRSIINTYADAHYQNTPSDLIDFAEPCQDVVALDPCEIDQEKINNGILALSDPTNPENAAILAELHDSDLDASNGLNGVPVFVVEEGLVSANDLKIMIYYNLIEYEKGLDCQLDFSFFDPNN